jgi:hypothetical protein
LQAQRTGALAGLAQNVVAAALARQLLLVVVEEKAVGRHDAL